MLFPLFALAFALLKKAKKTPVMQAIIQSYGIKEECLASSLSVEWFVRVIRPAILPFGLLLLITHAAPIGSAPKKVLYIFEGCFCKLEQLRRSCKKQMNGTNQELSFSLRSRRLEVVGTRKNGRVRRRHAKGETAPSPLACLPRARSFYLSPTTSKRLLRRLTLLGL